MSAAHRIMNRIVGVFLVVALATTVTRAGENDSVWLAGLSQVDVTPNEPVRLSGYGSRNHASEGIDTPLWVRCLAIRSAAGGQTSALISVDTIGLPASVTDELSQQLRQTHDLSREHLVFCSTHTHCAPDLGGQLSNIFADELSDSEVAASERYAQQLKDGILSAVDTALADMKPAKLDYATGEATFAANRRVLTDGRWTGFGVQPDGPVDHAVPVLRVAGSDGKLRGVVFNYACHCTTLGGDHYNVNGDWAGYASMNLESEFAGAVAICTIGCGGDVNPEPRGTLDAAKVHGRSLALEVRRIVDGPMKPVRAALQPRFEHLELCFELPSQQELEVRAMDASAKPQTRRHAIRMLELIEERGRLPATYPVPIQAWQFGDQLTMVFLGGEVVVDYALRLKKMSDNSDLWVTAYANDVLGYIASERMRGEGGYEYDFSGIYYGLPGPWASGTEDLLVDRVGELIE